MGCSWILAIIVFISTGNFFFAAVAFAIGCVINSLTKSNTKESPKKREEFMDYLLVLFACVMRADNRVTKMEVYYVRSFLEKSFGVDEANRLMLNLRDILKDNNIDLRQSCENVNRLLKYEVRLELLHILFDLSSLDGDITPQELEVIHQIASYLHISAWDFGTIQAIYLNKRQDNQNNSNYYQNRQTTNQQKIDNAYTILQVDKTATNEEIKKSYRKLVIKYHPDKVATLGEDVQKKANAKFQQINAAYELIKKERNFN